MKFLTRLRVAVAVILLAIVVIALAVHFSAPPTQTPTTPAASTLEPFAGQVYEGSVEELEMQVQPSSSGIRVGHELWIKVRLSGPKAWSVDEIRLTVIKPSLPFTAGVKVYDAGYALPHRTLAPSESPPQEYVCVLIWTAARSRTADNVEVDPGVYTFIIRTSVDGKQLSIEGKVEVIFAIPTKLPPAYALDIAFPSMPVKMRKGGSLTLPVTIKSLVNDPMRIRLALHSSLNDGPIPKFITYETGPSKIT